MASQETRVMLEIERDVSRFRADLIERKLRELPAVEPSPPARADPAPDGYLTTADAALFLSLDPKTVERKARRGDIPNYPPPLGERGYRFKQAELDAWMATRRQPSAQVLPLTRRRAS